MVCLSYCQLHLLESFQPPSKKIIHPLIILPPAFALKFQTCFKENNPSLDGIVDDCRC
ncbi:hypothetical protein SUGI_1148000 [Cryptomeria japonica]|nr:hypothetical protein SUGI_1148000 [Cryptomeria japonica]